MKTGQSEQLHNNRMTFKWQSDNNQVTNTYERAIYNWPVSSICHRISREWCPTCDNVWQICFFFLLSVNTYDVQIWKFFWLSYVKDSKVHMKKIKHIQLHSLLQGNYAKISAYFYLNFCNGEMLEKLSNSM